MSIFKKPKRSGSPEPQKPLDGEIPVTAVDLSKRYDLYCSLLGEDVVYEDVKIVGIRTLQRMEQFSSGLIGGYLEIEASDGTRMMISHHSVRTICENGFHPQYKVLRVRKLDSAE